VPQKPISGARRRLKAAHESLARAQHNVESMEAMLARMKAAGEATGVAEDLLEQFKQVVASRTKTHEHADVELERLQAAQAERQ